MEDSPSSPNPAGRPASEEERQQAESTLTCSVCNLRFAGRADRRDGPVGSQRANGTLSIPGTKLIAKPSPRTIGADIGFPNAVLNWAELLRSPDERPLFRRNPIAHIERPNTANSKRPVATYDRFLAVRAKADQ